jgi:hypothetical protein
MIICYIIAAWCVLGYFLMLFGELFPVLGNMALIYVRSYFALAYLGRRTGEFIKNAFKS